MSRGSLSIRTCGAPVWSITYRDRATRRFTEGTLQPAPRSSRECRRRWDRRGRRLCRRDAKSRPNLRRRDFRRRNSGVRTQSFEAQIAMTCRAGEPANDRRIKLDSPAVLFRHGLFRLSDPSESPAVTAHSSPVSRIRRKSADTVPSQNPSRCGYRCARDNLPAPARAGLPPATLSPGAL